MTYCMNKHPKPTLLSYLDVFICKWCHNVFLNHYHYHWKPLLTFEQRTEVKTQMDKEVTLNAAKNWSILYVHFSVSYLNYK